MARTWEPSEGQDDVLPLHRQHVGFLLNRKLHSVRGDTFGRELQRHAHFSIRLMKISPSNPVIAVATTISIGREWALHDRERLTFL